MSINEQILSAIDILVDNKIAKLQFDKTVQATIWSIVNLDTGEYKVKYSGNIFSAFANDLKEHYKVKDNVYVMIPEGDLSNRKVIVSKITDSSLSYGEIVSLTNSIIEKSPTFDTFYKYQTGEYGVVAGAPSYDNHSQHIVYQNSRDGYHGLFQQYANNYDLIRIKASFLTRFHCEHNQGNYGLEVVFFTKGDGEVAYRLDLESFNGDPYSLSVYSPQSVIVKAQKNYLTGLKSIRLFEEGFVYDRYVESGLVTNKNNTTEPNIFVKDIAIQYVEQRDLTENLYYLDIAAPQGCAFTQTSSSLDLVGRLLYQGENIMSEKTCKCQWFKRDLSVFIGNNLYDKNAGAGWTPVSPAAYDTMTLRPQDVIHQQRYKLVVTYNEKVILSDEIEIVNLTSGYGYEIVQKTEGDILTLELANNINSTTLVGDWYYSYPDGSYNAVKNGTKRNSIEVQDYLTYAYVKFYCAVYSYDKTKIVGTIEWTINNSTSNEDVIITYEGEDTFRYDANGDVAITDSEKERTLQVILTWKDNVATSYKVEWIGPDGKPITTTRQTPEHSMIENLWIDNSNILHYNIKQKYKNNYNNNTITVIIKTIDEQTYTFQKEILFLKDGDQGTNGTTYVTAVRPYDIATKLKLSGFNPLIYRNGWIKNLPLKCFVYKDGELINNNSNYTITYKWNSSNVNFAAGATSDCVTVSGNSQTLANPAYVKVQTTINDKMNGRKYDVYCSYPIDVSIGFTDIEIKNISIDDIPSYIKYTASGVNPQFYNSNIKFVFNGRDYSSSLESLTKNILDIESRDGGRYLKPASSFIFETNTMARLRGQYTTSKYIYHSIILYLDTYGNEAINGWDGTKLELDEEGQYIFAPQIGAGEKDSANRFTGVVMGKDNINDKVGLYGYQQGINTFGLMENGIAYFGAKSGGGQIVIDGTSAEIYGGGQYPAGSGQAKVGGEAENGMTITLANLKPNTNTYAIKIGAGKFGVKYDGTMEATGADIEGTIYALKGKIGGSKTNSKGWTIEENRLWSGTGTYHVELNSDQDTNFAIWVGKTEAGTAYDKSTDHDKTKSRISSPAKFVVTRDGYVHMNEAYIRGSIYADYITANDGGEIGGWTIAKRGLFSSNGQIGLSSNGTYRLWVNADRDGIINEPTFNNDSYFYVTSLGKLSCRDAEVRGKIYSSEGEIGGWTITESGLSKGTDIYIKSDGSMKITDNFTVTKNGKLTCKSADIEGVIYATSGKIGCSSKSDSNGWTIETNRLYSGTGTYHVELNSNQNTDFAIWAGKTSPGTAYNKNSTDTTKSKITSPAKFVITRDGYVHMNEAYIRGSIYADYITANDGGQIGGWTVTNRGLFGVNNKIGLCSTGSYRLWVNADSGTVGNEPTFNGSSYFYVTSSGKLNCKDAEVRGAIYSESGTIGGWYITSTRIQNSRSSPTVYLNSNGSARFGNFTITSGGSLRLGSYNTDTDNELSGDAEDTGVQFSVSRTGHLYCKSANIDGTIRAKSLHLDGSSNVITRNEKGYSSIGGDYINCKGLQVNGTNGSYFIVDSNGNVSIKGTITLDSSSIITWNQISDADYNLREAIRPLDETIREIDRDLTQLDRDYNRDIGYVEDFVRQFGYTSISATRIDTPRLNAGWITTGKIDVDLLETRDVWGLTIRRSTIESTRGLASIYIADNVNIEGTGLYINGQSLDDYIEDVVRPMLP